VCSRCPLNRFGHGWEGKKEKYRDREDRKFEEFGKAALFNKKETALTKTRIQWKLWRPIEGKTAGHRLNLMGLWR
jgi:hypothetical protein